MSIMTKIRKGCRDIWNAFMCYGADFNLSRNDIPTCPTTAQTLPTEIITWEEAKHIYKVALERKDYQFHHNAFVCFYIDDYKFDSTCGIWFRYRPALKILQHFAGVITPDFSTYQDFPKPIKLYATYRMRTIGHWFGKNGLAVINNVRWGSPETYEYCFDGIPKNSIVAIGTVGGSPRKLRNRKRFERGLEEMVRVLSPHTIIVYGSANYPCFKNLAKRGIRIVAYPSRMAQAFERRRENE